MVGGGRGISLLSLLLSALLGLGRSGYGALSQVILLVLILILVLSSLLFGRRLGEVVLADAANASFIDIVLIALLLVLTLPLLGAADLRDVTRVALGGVSIGIMDGRHAERLVRNLGELFLFLLFLELAFFLLCALQCLLLSTLQSGLLDRLLDLLGSLPEVVNVHDDV